MAQCGHRPSFSSRSIRVARIFITLGNVRGGGSWSGRTAASIRKKLGYLASVKVHGPSWKHWWVSLELRRQFLEKNLGTILVNCRSPTVRLCESANPLCAFWIGYWSYRPHSRQAVLKDGASY